MTQRHKWILEGNNSEKTLEGSGIPILNRKQGVNHILPQFKRPWRSVNRTVETSIDYLVPLENAGYWKHPIAIQNMFPPENIHQRFDKL